MNIRTAIDADTPAILALRGASIRGLVAASGQYTPAEVDAWASNDDPARVRQYIATGLCRVATDDLGQVMGVGRLVLHGPGRAEVKGVFVAPASAGLGVGRAILGALLDLAQSHDVQTLDLVATLNAQGFYEKLGFAPHERVRHTTPNGAVIPAVRMSVNLTPRTP